MTLYARHILPRLTHLAMRAKGITRERRRVVPLAVGAVVEIGVGSGLNLPIYGDGVRTLRALDPSRELLRMARRRAAGVAFPVELLEASAEAIPLDDRTADTVVTTWTLCTIPDPVQALREIRRILRPDGRLLFVEHGRSPDARVRAWQDRLTPVWRRLAGGCHLNRRIDGLLTEAGFEIERLDPGYGMGPRPFAYLYRGVARPDGEPGSQAPRAP